MMWFILGLVVLAGVVLVAVTARRARATYTPPPRRGTWEAEGRVGRVVRLDVTGVDPTDDAVQRLAEDAARRVLQAEPALTEVEVRDRDDVPLVTVPRRTTRHRDIALPSALFEPHAPTRHGPSPVRPEVGPRGPVPEAPLTLPSRPLAERLDLPPSVRDRVTEPDRAIDVIHAILLAAGQPSTVAGDLLRCGDVAIVVVDARSDAERALTHGYLRIEESGAARGLVVRTGYADPRVVRRREAAAPHVRHVGPDALQRMADAVAVGADPLSFALAPPASVVPGRG